MGSYAATRGILVRQAPCQHPLRISCNPLLAIALHTTAPSSSWSGSRTLETSRHSPADAEGGDCHVEGGSQIHELQHSILPAHQLQTAQEQQESRGGRPCSQLPQRSSRSIAAPSRSIARHRWPSRPTAPPSRGLRTRQDQPKQLTCPSAESEPPRLLQDDKVTCFTSASESSASRRRGGAQKPVSCSQTVETGVEERP